MRTFTRSLAALLFVAGAGVGLGACGSDDDGSGATTTTEPEADGPSSSTTTEAEGETTTSEGSTATGEAADFEAAIAESLGTADESGLVVTAEQAACVAPTWIEVIGVDAFTEAGLMPADVAEPSFTPDGLGLDVEQGVELIDAFEGCDIDIYEQYFEVLSAGLDAEQTACLEGEFDQDLSRQFLAEALTQPEPSAELEAMLDEIDRTCQLSA